MPITFTNKGLGGKNDQSRSIDWDDKLIMGLAKAEVKRGIRDATLAIERDAKRLIGQAGDQPSSPGRPPHQVTGELLASVSHEFEDEGLTGVVGTDLPHGRWLEFGTSKMAARPWLRPALNGVISRIEEFFGNNRF